MSDTETTEDQPETKELKIFRWTGSIFISKAGYLLRLPHPTIATAIVFFHRFYSYYPYLKYNKHLIASACLFIASKYYEKHRRLRDIINVMTRVRFPDRKELNIIGQEFFNYKEMITKHEQMVLRALKFELKVDLPQKYLLNQTKYLHNKNIRKETIFLINKISWTLLNDCLRTRLFLDYKPSDLSVAVIYISCTLLNKELQPKEWYKEYFSCSKETINEIGKEILKVYNDQPI